MVIKLQCEREKSKPVCDRNVKSEFILIKLSALISDPICETTAELHEKILFDSGVINLQTPTTAKTAPTNSKFGEHKLS